MLKYLICLNTDRYHTMIIIVNVMVLRGSVHLSHETLFVFFMNEVVILGQTLQSFLSRNGLITQQTDS